MKRIEFENDWVFDIDVESIKDYYGKQKDCADKQYIKRLPDSLKDFLAQFGIDYEKPCVNNKDIGLTFYVYGTAYTTIGFELDFYGENQFASIVIERDEPLCDNPSFTIWIFC
ncbi:MAG: hypothetical protein FWE85_02375 [Clostridiales bacterium]|nr:hypothetical protein [Clostridiales bacterium]